MVVNMQPDLERMIRQREFFALRRALLDYPPPDLAALIDELDTEDQIIVFRILPRELAADVFEYMELEAQEQLLKAMTQEHVARLLNDMAPTTAPNCWKNCPPPSRGRCWRS